VDVMHTCAKPQPSSLTPPVIYNMQETVVDVSQRCTVQIVEAVRIRREHAHSPEP